jgi:Holliday junction resolvase RusA-like endonuclease
MRFSIPGEPYGKGRPRVVNVGNRTMAFTPHKTVSYENLVKMEYQAQSEGKTFTDKQVRMNIRAYYGLPKSDSRSKRTAKLAGIIRPTKKPDIDNVYKIIADALNGIAYNDDSQIVSASVEKLYSETPRVDVTIEEVQHETLLNCQS